jgi:hypothetical protein
VVGDILFLSAGFGRGERISEFIFESKRRAVTVERLQKSAFSLFDAANEEMMILRKKRVLPGARRFVCHGVHISSFLMGIHGIS